MWAAKRRFLQRQTFSTMQQDIIRTYYIAYEQGNLDSEVIYAANPIPVVACENCYANQTRLMPPWSRCVEPVEGPRRGWMMFFHLELVGLKVSVPKSIHVKWRKKPVGPASNNNISGVLVSKNWRRKKLFQVVGQLGRCYYYPLDLAWPWCGWVMGLRLGSWRHLKVSSRSRYFC